MRKCAVGGQAVMEGVMMKSDKGIAMAVRRADGKIVASYKNQVSKAQKGTFWGLPVIRGVVALVESLTTGMSTTMDSAKMYGEDAFADEEPTKFEKWLAKTFGKSVEKIAITVALVLGVALAVGLFVLLPQLISSMIFGQKSTSCFATSILIIPQRSAIVFNHQYPTETPSLFLSILLQMLKDASDRGTFPMIDSSFKNLNYGKMSE